MDCPNCKTTEATKLITVPDEEGGTFQFCDLCPRPKKKEINFPAIIIKGKRGRGRPRKTASGKENGEDKFEKYKLTDDEIRRTQSLRSKRTEVDTPKKRDLDNIDLVNQGKRAIVYCGGYAERRQLLAKRKIEAQLGTSDFTVLSDDGFKIMAQANG